MSGVVRRIIRFVLVVGALKVVALAAITAWLLRDPTPTFDARRSALARAEVGSVTSDGVTSEQDVRIVATSGLSFEVAIRRPAAPESVTVRRQLFVVLGGHERGKGAAQLIGDTRGAIFASIEYPFSGNHRAKGLAVLAEVPAIRRALYDTPPAVSLALDHLLSRPDVDPARVELVGASFGAPFATIAAARDERVSRLWLAHGGGDTYALIARGLEREIANAPLRAGVAHLGNLLASGPRFTPEQWIGQLAPRPLVMLNAEEDEKIPRRSVDILYAAAGEPKELIWLPGKHMMGSRPEVIEQLIAAVQARAVIAPAPR